MMLKPFVAWTTVLLLSISLWGDEVATEAASQSKSSAAAETNQDVAAISDPTQSEKIQLTFREQEWLPALKWLAEIQKLNLDWQSLPEGTFNLHSTKDYSIAEAEDLINLQLLGRGFTLLKRGEVLRVVPLQNIDITLVPHVDSSTLEQRDAHQFVRVSFPLEWMIAEEAAKEFKPLLSPYGQLFPMSSSNRLEAMDAVVNLREIHRLLTRAEKDEGRRERVAEFQLQYRKAEEIAPKVRQLLGLPGEGSPSTNAQTQLEIEQARFKAEAVKQIGSSATELLTDKKPTVFITVNDKENSILVNAPPNKLEIVRQAIDALDKPVAPTSSTWETLGRVKVYEVNGFDPDTISRLLASLQERGNLAKETRIQHEAAYNRLIVFASPEDHLTINQVVDSFRAQRRSAAVLPLATLDPVYAVKSVQLILKAPERPSSAPGVASDGRFQIEADPERRRLLLWATPDEVTEVREFLLRLGETYSQSISNAQMHVVPLNGSSLDALSPRLEMLWKGISDAPLIIDRNDSTETHSTVDPMSSRSPDAHEATKPTGEITLDSANPLGERSRFVSKESDSLLDDAIVTKDSVDGKSPVRIIRGEGEELIILSRDPVAAESAKRLIEQLTPSPSDIRVVVLKHAQAVSVKPQLDAMLQHTIDPVASRLSTAKPFKIDIDARTNRLLIQHASPRQLELISQMIPIIDQPTSTDERLVRTQKVYRFRYRKAADVSDMVKEVYRDLLSVNDRVYANVNRPTGYNRNLAATAINPEYQGLLAIGVDREANILVISAPTYLIDNVLELVRSVDTPVDGTSVAILPFAGGTPTDTKQSEALSRILGKRK